jgi:hypothetical protein
MDFFEQIDKIFVGEKDCLESEFLNEMPWL